MHERTKQVLTGVAVLAAAGGIAAGIAGAAGNGGARQGPGADERDNRLGRHGGPAEGPGDHRGTALTGAAKRRAVAAAQAKLPNGTVRGSYAAASPGVAGSKYVVAMTRSDGTPAIVVLDAGYDVLRVVDKRPFGHRGGPPPAQLTGDTAAKARSAARAAVPSGTVRGAFAAPPGTGAAYAVIVEGAGSGDTIVLLDKDFNVVRRITDRERDRARDRGRRGPGHPGPEGAHPGPAGGAAPEQDESGTTTSPSSSGTSAA